MGPGTLAPCYGEKEVSRVEFQGGEASAEMAGNVLVVRFSGLLVAHGLADMKARIVAQMRAAPGAVLADYSRAVLALTAEQLDDMMAADTPENLYHLPAVVVAPRGGAQALQSAAVKAAMHHGAFRSVAQNPATALGLAHCLMDLAAAARPGTSRP